MPRFILLIVLIACCWIVSAEGDVLTSAQQKRNHEITEINQHEIQQMKKKGDELNAEIQKILHKDNKHSNNDNHENRNAQLLRHTSGKQQQNQSDQPQAVLPIPGSDIQELMREQHRHPPQNSLLHSSNIKRGKSQQKAIKTTSSTKYSASLLTSYPTSDFTWYGGGSTSYTFANYNSLDTPSLCIYGDTGTGGRGLESTFSIYGDSRIIISYYAQQSCSDPGISIFPETGSSYWNWGFYYSRIQFALNCGQPCLYGKTSENCASSASLSTGLWYTLVLDHTPSLYQTSAYVYSGRNVDLNYASPIASMYISEYYGSTEMLRFSINADVDESYSYTNFAYLTVEYAQDGEDDDDDDTATGDVITSYYADLFYSIPSEMTWYGGYTLGYGFDNSYSTGVYSLIVYGDAGSDGSGRGFESNFYVSGDFTVQVSFYAYLTCMNPGISIFPVQSAWMYSTYPGRIQAVDNCGVLYLFGQTQNNYAFPYLSTGYWYTMVLKHAPSTATTTVSYYMGSNVDPSTSYPLSTTTIYETYPASTLLKVGFAADTNYYSVSCQFAHFKVKAISSSSTSAPTLTPLLAPSSKSKSPTRSPTTSAMKSFTPTAAPSASPYYSSLYYGFSSDLIWYGGYGLTYSFYSYYTSIYSLTISGDAGTGARGVESTYQFQSDKQIRVSFYLYNSCTDPGLAIFPTSGSNYWYWGPATGRIQASVECGAPVLYGETSSASTSYTTLPLTTGSWYTIVLNHLPSLGKTTASYYRGYDIDPDSSSSSSVLMTELTIYESFGTSKMLRMGLAADPDSDTICQFAELRVNPISSSIGFASMIPTFKPTAAPIFSASLLSSLPSEMSFYGSYSSLSYSFGDFYGTGISSLALYGDASDGSRGIETSFKQYGDFSVRVSFYMYEKCTDPGLSIFKSQSYWYWGANVNRIQLSVNCGQPVLYGLKFSASGTTYLTEGYWYTLVLSHSSSTGTTKGYYYRGYDVDPMSVSSLSSSISSVDSTTATTSSSSSSSSNSDSLITSQDANVANVSAAEQKPHSVKVSSTGTLIASLSIAESFSSYQGVGMGISADTDSYGSYCQFAYFKVIGSTVDEDDDSSGRSTSISFSSSSTGISVTIIIVIVVLVVVFVSIPFCFGLYFACRKGRNSAKVSNYPDFTPSAPPAAPVPPVSAPSPYTSMPVPTPVGGHMNQSIPSNMPVPTPVTPAPPLQQVPIVPLVKPMTTPSYMQPNVESGMGGMPSSYQQPYSSGLSTSSYPYGANAPTYQLPVATAIPAVQTGMPLTGLSSSYAPLPINAPSINTYQPSEPMGMGGYSSMGTTGGAYGGYNVEMVPVDVSPRGTHNL